MQMQRQRQRQITEATMIGIRYWYWYRYGQRRRSAVKYSVDKYCCLVNSIVGNEDTIQGIGIDIDIDKTE